MQLATEDQLTQIRHRAVNDVTRAVAREGVALTYEQADDIGVEGLAWLCRRLGLIVVETNDGVECQPHVR